MAKVYGSHSYAGGAMLEPMIKPHIQDKALTDFGINVDVTDEKAWTWTMIEVGDQYLYPYESGFKGGNSGVLTDKQVALVKFKKRNEI